MEKLYLKDKDVYLEKNCFGVSFCIDSEWVTEPIRREDIPFLLVFGVEREVLEDFFN